VIEQSLARWLKKWSGNRRLVFGIARGAADPPWRDSIGGLKVDRVIPCSMLQRSAANPPHSLGIAGGVDDPPFALGIASAFST